MNVNKFELVSEDTEPGNWGSDYYVRVEKPELEISKIELVAVSRTYAGTIESKKSGH